MLIIDEWMRDMPQQFLGKKNIEVLVAAFSRQLQEIRQVFDDMNTKVDLDTAVGQNLDYVGTIIPLSRKEAGELAGINDTDPVISDERYRQFLRYKLLVNTNECTYYDLMEGLALLWDVSPIYYIEDPAFPATIILTMPFLKPGGEVVTLGEVPMVKPAGVRIEFEYRIKVAIEVLVRWICLTYQVPLCNQLLCGTHPRRGTLGNFVYAEMEVGLKEIQEIFEFTKCGTVRVGGVLYDSTAGKIITDGVEFVINSNYEVEKVILAGHVVSGTYPVRSVNGFGIGKNIEIGGVITDAKAKLPVSGTNITGGGKMEPAALEAISESVGINSAIHIAAGEAPRCGSGKAVKTMSVSGSAISMNPTITIAAANVRKCGTGVCGNK